MSKKDRNGEIYYSEAFQSVFFHIHKVFNPPQNLYKEAWEKVKATSYILPSTTMSLTHAKNQKDLSSNVSHCTCDRLATHFLPSPAHHHQDLFG